MEFPSESSSVQLKSGFAVLIGTPNSGKSTLVNQLVGAKVSIVSRKSQTTRMMIRGIATVNDTQIVLVDTPGIFNPHKRFDHAMVDAAWTGASDADVIILLVDCTRSVDNEILFIMDKLKEKKIPITLVLNKIDKVNDKQNLLSLVEQFSSFLQFKHIFMLSALKGDGVNKLLQALAEVMPNGPWYFPKNEISDLPMRIQAAEITREKIYDRLHQELPYSITVETSSWKTLRNKSVRIEQTIFVEQESQKKIVIGKNGQSIKAISSQARFELFNILGKKVHLFLFVKVCNNWTNDPARYSELGLKFPK
ncbi:MAG: GTPase Era [Hyphomicrobiaceae bacterium]|nr:GTPase Era [Hyphomicrobiaceae bacterium]